MSPHEPRTPGQRILSRLLVEYGELRKPVDIGAVNTVLSRYAAVWASDSIFDETNSLPAPDAVARLSSGGRNVAGGAIRYWSFAAPSGHGPWNHIRRLAALPLLARLNYVRQLSTTNIGLNLEATHNRLAHLLGTLDICALMLKELCENAPEEALPTEAEATATLLYALIHDLYHGPFGHSLDLLGGLVFGQEESRIDKGLLTEQVAESQNRTGALWEIIALVAKWISSDSEKWKLQISGRRQGNALRLADEISEFLAALILRKDNLARTNPLKYWLREIVDGPLDADRLDYLLRDVHALHWPTAISADQLVPLIQGGRLAKGTVAVLSQNPKTGGWERSGVHVMRVCWARDQAADVGRFLSARADLYREVYESPHKRGFDEMLAHALVWILRDIVGPDESALVETLRRAVAVTDDELFHFFYETAVSGGGALPLAIVHDLATGRPFLPVWHLDIPIDALEASQIRQEELADKWAHEEAEFRKGGGHVSHILPIIDSVELLGILRNSVDVGDEETVLALAYFIEQLHGRNFTSRDLLERAVWRELMVGAGDPSVKQLIEDELGNVFGRLVSEDQDSGTLRRQFLEQVRNYPLCFISIPWAPRAYDDPGLADWEPQDEVMFHDLGEVVDASPDISHSAKQRFYPIIVYLPPCLARHQQITRCVDRLMYSLFASLIWYRPDVLTRKRPIEWVKNEVDPDWADRFRIRFGNER